MLKIQESKNNITPRSRSSLESVKKAIDLGFTSVMIDK